jgi:hypothetical protein
MLSCRLGLWCGVALLSISIALDSSFACPDNQYESCTPSLLGQNACGCLPKVGGDVVGHSNMARGSLRGRQLAQQLNK